MLTQTIIQLLSETGKTKTSLCNHLGIARTTLDDYLSGTTYMTSDKIEKAAEFFGVSVGYLFGEQSSKTSLSEIKKLMKKQQELLNIIANSLQIVNK